MSAFPAPPATGRPDDGERILETSLYPPVKAFLEGLGFAVKGEVGGCDLVALARDGTPIVVIGELKLSFNLELVLQAVDRATACDEVWLAARTSARGNGRESERVSATCVGAWVSGRPASRLRAR